MMKMKPSRFIILLIAAVMLLGTVGAVSAAPTLVVEVPTEEVAVGETITVPVIMQDAVPFMTFKIDIANDVKGAEITVYTEKKLQYGEEITVIPGGLAIGSYECNSDVMNSVQEIAWIYTRDITTSSSEPFFNLNITVTANNILEVPVKLTISELNNNAGVNLAPQVVVQDAVVKVVRAPPVASSVGITAPVDDTELAYGTEGQAVAVVYDQYGEVMDAEVTWSVCKSDSIEPATGLSIDAAGNYKVVNCAEEAVQIFAKSGDVSTSNVVKLVKADLESDDFTVTGLGEFVWTGQPFAVTVTAKDDGVGDISVTYNGKSDVPTAKGTYAVNISVTKGDNYNAVSNLFLGEIAITGTVIVPPTLGAFPTYNGEEQTIDLVDSANSAGMYEVSGNIGTNAGAYTVTLTLKDTVNTEWKDADSASITLDWKILPQSLAGAKITATAVSYTGAAPTPEFTVTLGEDILIEGTDYTLDAETGIAAGNYAVTVTGKGNYEGTASGEWTIAKATPTEDMISCEIPTGLTYTGEPQTLTASAQGGIYGLGEITLQYNGDDAAVNAGEYTVTANIAEGANYTAATDLAVGSLTIGKATLDKDDFILSATSAEYDGEAQAVTVTPKVAGVTVTGIQYNGSDTAPSEKGEYVLTITATGGNNYNDVTDLAVGTFVITGRQVAKPEITGTYTYTGEVLTADIAESDDYTVTGNTATAAGTHTVIVSLTDKDNTAWKNGGIDDLELEWVIAPKSITGASVTTSTETDVFTYDGSVKTPTFIVTDGTLTIAAADYTVEGDISSAVAGKHQVTIKGQNNYTGEITAEWNIAPAVPTLDNIDFTIPYGVVYGQTYEVPAAAKDTVFGLGDITLKYNETPVNAGTYLVNASIAAGTNYTAAELYLGNLVINKADPTIENLTFSIPTGVIYGKKYNVTVGVADGVVGLENITLKYNGTAAAPLNAGTYLVNASVEGTNYNATELYLGNLVINKAELTKDDFTITPALPVSYEEGSAEAVVVTVKEGIFGNGTVTVKYGVLTTVPTTEGIYKVNATFGAGTNYTAADFYLGDMTIVKKVAPEFGDDVVTENANGSITVTGGYTVYANTTTITDSSSGVVLSIKFADYETDGSKIIGNISKVNATYPEISAASPKDGEFKYGLVINLGNNLTNALPAISSVYDEAVAGKVKPSGKTFEGLVMIGAEDVDDVNAAIKAGKGDVKLTFKIPKSAVPADEKNKIVVYHVSDGKATKVEAVTVDSTTYEDFHLVTVTGSGFSSYVAGIENDVSTGGNGGGAAILIPSSSKTPTTVTPPEVPVDPETPSDEPGEVPSEIPGTTPSEPGKSPAPILGVLAALGAAVVLRRK